MIDLTELKSRAEALIGRDDIRLAPDVILALIDENEQLAKTADCWDRLNVQNKALSDSFRAERDQLKAAISTPELVFINMKSGRIAKISLRSAIDLHGEVINGDDAQQIEIAKLRAEVAGLKTGYEAYEQVNAELNAKNEVLLSALTCMTSMYGHCWDLVDGGLLCMQSNVQRFEDAHEVAQKAIAAIGRGEQS